MFTLWGMHLGLTNCKNLITLEEKKDKDYLHDFNYKLGVGDHRAHEQLCITWKIGLGNLGTYKGKLTSLCLCCVQPLSFLATMMKLMTEENFVLVCGLNQLQLVGTLAFGERIFKNKQSFSTFVSLYTLSLLG